MCAEVRKPSTSAYAANPDLPENFIPGIRPFHVGPPHSPCAADSRRERFERFGRAAKDAGEGGGFKGEADEPRMIGQVQVTELANPEAARTAVLRSREEILAAANALHPAMKARGGGAKDLQVRLIKVGEETHAVV